MNTRRQFLIQAPIALAGVVAACQDQKGAAPAASDLPAGAPPTFGTAPGTGPQVSANTFAEAEKLMQVTMTPAEREMAAASWRSSLASYLERRVGPRKVPLAPDVAPATRWNPVLSNEPAGPTRDRFVRT